MRVTWLLACEKVLFLGDQISAMNIYLDRVPWRGPDVGIPFAVIMTIAPLEEKVAAQRVAIRILTEAGNPIAESAGMLPAAQLGRVGKAIIEGNVTIQEPGRYSLEILVDGAPLDDAPTWSLHLVSQK